MIVHQPHNSTGNYTYNAYFYKTEKWDFHFHKNFEIIYVLEGSVSCMVNNKKYKLSAGQFGLCLPYDIHSYHPAKNSLYWVCVFSEDYVRYFCQQTEGKTGNGFSFTCSPNIKTYITDTLLKNEAPSVYTLKSCLYALCEEYLNAVELIEKDKTKTRTMANITDFIKNNYKENLTLADVANFLGYEYHYVSRYFGSVFNMSFKDFLNIYRLENAVRLLEETDKNLSEIAYESGFQSVRTFNHCFISNFKMSPSQYKKQQRKTKKP